MQCEIVLKRKDPMIGGYRFPNVHWGCWWYVIIRTDHERLGGGSIPASGWSPIRPLSWLLAKKNVIQQRILFSRIRRAHARMDHATSQ